MFTVKPNGPNRVDIEFSGKLDSDEMKAALDELVDKTQGVENGRMLYRVGEFKLPTISAMVIRSAGTAGIDHRLIPKASSHRMLCAFKKRGTASRVK